MPSASYNTSSPGLPYAAQPNQPAPPVAAGLGFAVSLRPLCNSGLVRTSPPQKKIKSPEGGRATDLWVNRAFQLSYALELLFKFKFSIEFNSCCRVSEVYKPKYLAEGKI